MGRTNRFDCDAFDDEDLSDFLEEFDDDGDDHDFVMEDQWLDGSYEL